MLTGKNIVVNGCLSGIGRETIKRCAENGANVFAYSVNEEEIREYCLDLSKKNDVEIIPIHFDNTNIDEIERCCSIITQLNKDIHGVISISDNYCNKTFDMIKEKEIKDIFQTNFYSQIFFSQHIAKLMIKNGVPGSIAFLSSVSALDGREGELSYASSKAALLGAMRTMAKELGKKGIRVNAVATGVLQTSLINKMDENIIDEIIQMVDLKRIGEEKEVADVFVFLMSDLSSHITGQTIRSDGGMR